MTEDSPLPGTLRSNTREVTDEPCTKKTTGRAGSPGFGAPSLLRHIHKGTSPFLVQYSLLQISPPSPALCAGEASASAPAIRPRPAPLISVRRGNGCAGWVMVLPQMHRLVRRILTAAGMA